MENNEICNYCNLLPYYLNEELQWCLLLTTKVMLSLTLPCVCYSTYTATAFPGLLFNSVLPYQIHLRMRMTNLNPLGHLLILG